MNFYDIIKRMDIKPIRPEAPRIELMKLLNTLAEKRVIYIHAPAGYGKTFSVKLWLRQKGALNAWIALGDKQINRQGGFYKIGTLALLMLQPENSALKEIYEHPSFNSAPYEFAARAVKNLKAGKRERFIVLDDLHLIREEENLKTLPTFINLLPKGFTVFVLSRSAPPDSFSELVIKDRAAIVDNEALKFTHDEIKEYFKECGRPLSQTEALGIYSRTGGWAIGINALLMANTTAIHKKITERHFNVFLRDKVWALWDKPLQDFMMKTSVVPELTPKCAAALTGAQNSKKILEELLWENAFVNIDASGVYRFHDLFRDFLLGMLSDTGESVVNKQFKKCADWFYEQKDYYRAVEYYVKCKDHSGISKGLLSLYYYNSFNTSLENMLSIIRLSVDDTIVEKYPFLLELQAWAVFVEGRAGEFEKYVDQYYKMYPQIVLQNPVSEAMFILIRRADYRHNYFQDTKTYHKAPFKRFGKIPASMISLNMPFYHRTSRDDSEYAFENDKGNELLDKSIGVLMDAEFVIIKNCILAGIQYEKGYLTEAYKFALAANSNIRDEFSPELKFCAKMILASVYAGLKQLPDAEKILDSVTEMIERDKAYYLTVNFEAYNYRLRLQDGDEEAAAEWLEKAPNALAEQIKLYRLYCCLTTARAQICIGEYNSAMLFLQKILALVEAYRWPIDIIETHILLAVTCWKKGRGHQKDAIEFLEKAVAVAQGYGYTQVFVNESADIANMMQKIQFRRLQKNYEGPLSRAFVKHLHLAVLVEAKRFKGLTGGKVSKNLKFTAQQLNVMRHLASGHSYNEIAQIMGITYNGIRAHMKFICKKLDAPSSFEAVVKIKELRIFDK
ncbi:MAG: LuxR C-terminal-related transcriptional regulator [Chitinispirillales bacterium]|jgi:LuxR family maltose regulon positive regulatory protein|nr:LuxR C-terminal-related transcriptional regulator [Chitinispirillales bacterium]